jgi:hypothetical protein
MQTPLMKSDSLAIEYWMSRRKSPSPLWGGARGGGNDTHAFDLDLIHKAIR